MLWQRGKRGFMKHLVDILATPELLRLRAAYQAHGFDTRAVGGPVRDLLLGEVPKDIDLCTDADPDEGQRICEAAGFRTIPTGLQHGTFTVLLEEPVEITTLRVDTEHDGRHAQVEFIRDWTADLARRDLTINAMSLTLDGELHDPFGGHADLMARRVRFVGSAAERMREDHLRILRWLRFQTRFAPDQPFDAEALDASRSAAEGLRGISRERVWSEMSRVLASRAGLDVYGRVAGHIGAHIGLPRFGDEALERARAAYESGVRDPAGVLALLLGTSEAVASLAREWKWSGEDRDRALFLAHHLMAGSDPRWLVAHDGARQDWAGLLCRLRGDAAEGDALDGWQVPVFPLRGADLLGAGCMPGKTMGDLLRRMRRDWAEGGFRADASQLMDAHGLSASSRAP